MSSLLLPVELATPVSNSTAVTWGQFEGQASELAERIQLRFESQLHAVMATLRQDRSPRLSGMEAPIRDGLSSGHGRPGQSPLARQCGEDGQEGIVTVAEAGVE